MLTFFKNPLALAGIAALIAWWLLRKKADCHCPDTVGTTPPVIGIWQGYNADPYSGTRTPPGRPACPDGMVNDINTGVCVNPIY